MDLNHVHGEEMVGWVGFEPTTNGLKALFVHNSAQTSTNRLNDLAVLSGVRFGTVAAASVPSV